MALVLKFACRKGMLQIREASCFFTIANFHLSLYIPFHRALVAQLDRVPDYESGGRGFESFPERQPFKKVEWYVIL